MENTITVRQACKWIALGIFAIFALVTVIKSGTQVPADSVGVLTFFGKRAGIVQPGFHATWPYIEQIISVPVRRQRKLDFGLPNKYSENIGNDIEVGTVTNELLAQADPKPDEQDAITGDKNLVLIQWSLFYKIGNPEAYLFDSANPEGTLRGMADAAMHEVIGDSPASWVLSSGRPVIESLVLNRLQEFLVAARQANIGDIGLEPVSIQILSLTVPQDVQGAFTKVSQSQQEAASLITNANGQALSNISTAKGEANRVVNAAKGESAKILSEAEGETSRFVGLLKEYNLNPEAYRTRLTMEAWTQAAQQAKSLVVYSGDGPVVPVSPLNIPVIQPVK